MKFKNCLLIIAGLVCINLTAYAGGEKEKKADSNVYKIGYNTNLSVGGATEQGNASREGFELGIEEINAAGGINGKLIELVTYDDEGKPEKAVENITRLINSDEVLAIVGFVNSGNVLASMHLAQQSEIPMFVNFATATDITLRYKEEPKNYIFRYAIIDSDQISRILDFVVEKKYKKIAIIHDTSGYGTNAMKDIVSQMKKRGIKPAMIETLNTNDTDMTTQLQKFKNADVDCVIQYALSPENANTIRSAQKINYNPAFIGSWANGFGSFKRLAGDLKEGVFTTTAYVIGQNEKSTKLNKNMIAKYGEDVLPIASAFGYDSAYMIAEAIKVGGNDSKAVRDAMENMESFDGVVGKINKPFTKEDHEAMSRNEIFTAVWKGDVLVAAE